MVAGLPSALFGLHSIGRLASAAPHRHKSVCRLHVHDARAFGHAATIIEADWITSRGPLLPDSIHALSFAQRHRCASPARRFNDGPRCSPEVVALHISTNPRRGRLRACFHFDAFNVSLVLFDGGWC